MYDDDDFDEPRAKEPELPRELRERLFDYSNPANPAILYSAIGPEKWPQTTAFGAKQGFTTWRNPATREVRIYLHLGPDPQLHTGFEMNLIPSQHRMSRAKATERIGLGQCLRREYNRLLICIPPGATLAIPAVYDRAIRTVRDGIVISGYAPQLLIEGETDPPEIHPALLPAADVEGPIQPGGGAAARRRT